MPTISRIFHAPEQSFFLLGPRGTGKSTWLHAHFPYALWIDLLDPELLRLYGAQPERLRQTLLAYPDKKVVVIDEIQKLPQLLTIIHAIIEEKLGYQFILTGSSARKLKRQSVDLLAGRALLCHMHPFLASELGDLFNLDLALMQGMLPLVWDSPSPQAVLKSYCALYLKEEVQSEGLVRDAGHFARFMEVISFSHATTLNTSNIARECGISRTTIDTYLQILKDLLLGFTVDVFSKRAQRALSTHPKFYLFDAGVFRSLRPVGPIDSPLEVSGVALEGLVAQHLRAWIDAQEDRYDLAFWRTRSGLEVDFIIYGPKGFWAIEVKNSIVLSPKDTNGLRAFKEEYPEASTLLLYRGKQRLVQKDILCVPCEEFLQNLHPSRLIQNNMSLEDKRPS
ncbi:MAG: ATP-binding protein [Nitrosomonas sp.]|nr:MAG: ATP-binding protein [Nitrosomonas sp.]